MIEDRQEEISQDEAIAEIKELEEQLEDTGEVTEEVAGEVEPEKEDEVVARAKKYGHVSKDDWVAQGKDPNQWKSPEEFDKTGKILEQLYSLRKKVEQRDREIQALVEYQQRTSQREYDRAKKDLEQRIQTSKDDMDVAGVEYYSKELANLQATEQQNQVQYMYQQQQDALNNFKERNKHWFNENNPDLVHRATVIDQELKSIYPNASYEELAQKIEARIKYEYPDRTGTGIKPRPAISVSQSSVNKTVAVKSSAPKAFKELSKDLQDVYYATKRIRETIPDSNEYTVAEFIDQLKKDGEL